MIEIPLSKLSSEALRGVIDEFIMREGTDYGHADYCIEQKRQQVMAQLEQHKAMITFDPQTETTSILIK